MGTNDVVGRGATPEMKRETKCWGERWLLREDSTHATAFLKLKKGHECSWHYHKTKWNLFVVLWGRIQIVTEHPELANKNVLRMSNDELGRLIGKVLKEGEEMIIPPGVKHKFMVLEDSGVIEEMYVEYDEEDIVRETEGK